MSEVKKALDYGVAGLFGAVFGIAIQQVKESTIKCSCYGWKIATIILFILLVAGIGYYLWKEYS